MAYTIHGEADGDMVHVCIDQDPEPIGIVWMDSDAWRVRNAYWRDMLRRFPTRQAAIDYAIRIHEENE